MIKIGCSLFKFKHYSEHAAKWKEIIDFVCKTTNGKSEGAQLPMETPIEFNNSSVLLSWIWCQSQYCCARLHLKFKYLVQLVMEFAGPASDVRVERVSRDCFKDGGAIAEVVAFYESKGNQDLSGQQTAVFSKEEKVDAGLEVTLVS